MLFAIYDDGVFTGREIDLAEKPTFAGKPYRKLYTAEYVKPTYDAATQVRTGPVVQEDHAAETRRYVWTVRDKTAEELDADKAIRIDALDLVALRGLFNHENRIRALEGKAAITVAQFKAAIKAII
jgi:hypothetical protein